MDGKVNALSPAMQASIAQALDQAEADIAAGTVKAVVLAGNEKVFSAGFELSVFASGDVEAGHGMLAGGFELAIRLLTFPAPVVMAATGPAIAMGSFLLLSADHRVGSQRSRCQANEVAIGMTLPIAALEIMRMHLNDQPPNPRSLRPNLPESLSAIILQCLDKARLRRPGSASDLERLLMRVRP